MTDPDATSLASLARIATEIGDQLRQHSETVAIAESSAGGLIAAALLAVPGASAYFRGGAVVYTLAAKRAFLGLTESALTEPRAATEGHALVLARGVREALDTSWGLGETGATGPTGNRYGDGPGHACLAVSGPSERALTIETGSDDREANMFEFARAALRLLLESLEARRG